LTVPFFLVEPVLSLLAEEFLSSVFFLLNPVLAFGENVLSGTTLVSFSELN